MVNVSVPALGMPIAHDSSYVNFCSRKYISGYQGAPSVFIVFAHFNCTTTGISSPGFMRLFPLALTVQACTSTGRLPATGNTTFGAMVVVVLVVVELVVVVLIAPTVNEVSGPLWRLFIRRLQ